MIRKNRFCALAIGVACAFSVVAMPTYAVIGDQYTSTYVYDDNGVLLSITIGERVVHFNYDDNGNVKSTVVEGSAEVIPIDAPNQNVVPVQDEEPVQDDGESGGNEIPDDLYRPDQREVKPSDDGPGRYDPIRDPNEREM